MGVVIPFGKYKGSEVESIKDTDPQYLDWLSLQPDLRKKWPEIAAAISDSGSEDSPTHNALQAQFLDDDLCFRLIRGRGISTRGIVLKRIFECEFDVVFSIDKPRRYESHDNWAEFRIECKPTIGDDYPAVLRQVRQQTKRRHARYVQRAWNQRIDAYVGPSIIKTNVVYGSLKSETVPVKDIKRIFQASGDVRLISIEELGGTIPHQTPTPTPRMAYVPEDFLTDPL